jgi:hypothetical protein
MWSGGGGERMFSDETLNKIERQIYTYMFDFFQSIKLKNQSLILRKKVKVSHSMTQKIRRFHRETL